MHATDDSAVVRVELFVDGGLIGEDRASPYGVAWSAGSAPATRTLRAVAHDDAGLTSQHEITVTVGDDASPAVEFLNPISGDTVSGNVDVELRATDDGEISSVTIYADGTVLAANRTGGDRYRAAWGTCGRAGPATLTALVGDYRSQATWAAVDVDVDNSDPPAPPQVDAYPSATDSPTLTISGSKPSDATVTVDGRSVAGAGTSRWSADIALVQGPNSFVVDTTNSCGRTSGAPVTVRVRYDDPGLLVTIAEPTEGAAARGTVVVRGTVSGGLAPYEVQLFVEGVDSDTDMTSDSFSLQWSTGARAAGPVILTVTAEDGAGESASTSITLDVRSWSVVAPTLVTEEPGLSDSPGAPALGGFDSAVVVVWQDRSASYGNDTDIFVRWYDAQLNLSSSGVVSTHALDGRSRDPSIAPSGGDSMHVVWLDDGGLDRDTSWEVDVYYRSWSPSAPPGETILVSPSSHESASDPRVANGNGVAHVVWTDYSDYDGDGQFDADIMYTRGVSPPVPILLSDHPNDDRSDTPDIAISPDTRCPHVVWVETGGLDPADTDGGRADLYHRAAAGASCTWGAPRILDPSGGLTPSIGFDPRSGTDTLWIAYRRSAGRGAHVYLSKLESGVPGIPIRVSEGSDDLSRQWVDLDVDVHGRPHVVWVEYRNDGARQSEVLTRFWTGTALSPLESISDAPPNLGDGFSNAPRVLARTPRVFAWTDDADYDGDGVRDWDVMLQLH